MTPHLFGEDYRKLCEGKNLSWAMKDGVSQTVNKCLLNVYVLTYIS